MKHLQDNWLTEGIIDFEYKKYLLLAYLKSSKEYLERQLLYPTFSDLIFHYNNLLALRDGQQSMRQQFPKELEKADLETFELTYKHKVTDGDNMQVISEVLQFAIPKFNGLLLEARSIYEYIIESLELIPIGISPLNKSEGYIFIQPVHPPETLIYYYQQSVFQGQGQRFRGIHLQLLDTFRKGVGDTYEGIKLQLLRKYKHLPNPATFLIQARVPCPFEESVLPIAKRMLLQHLG